MPCPVSRGCAPQAALKAASHDCNEGEPPLSTSQMLQRAVGHLPMVNPRSSNHVNACRTLQVPPVVFCFQTTRLGTLKTRHPEIPRGSSFAQTEGLPAVFASWGLLAIPLPGARWQGPVMGLSRIGFAGMEVMWHVC